MHSALEIGHDNGMELAPDRSLPEVYHQPYVQYKPYEETQQVQNSAPDGAEITRLKRITFWLLVALIVVIALALGLGTGLGLGLRDNNNVKKTGTSVEGGPTGSSTTSPPPAASSTGSSTTSTSSTSTTTSTSTQPAAEATPTSLIDSGCPNANGSTLTKSTITYNVYCNSDLTGSDLASLVTNSLEECLTLCDSVNWTQKRKDVGAVWNEEGVIGQTAGTCWCKGGNSIKVTAKAGIVVASPVPQ